MKPDYESLGLVAGLEIHQQLDTKKLFCRCPSILRSDEPRQRVKRKLNVVAGETGVIDIAAIHEASKEKTYIYQTFDSTCLVELDEEPPHQINEEALKIVLQIAHLLNAKIFPVTQIMRKTVLDGSNTSGFQRTVLIAHDGFIETSKGKVGIETIALEEDSARKVSEENNSKTYRLDRLGIPLVEITTKPDLKTAEQIKEAALKIGEILRSCKVKRGIGTIRQDMNISILGSKRVEIKGFQDPKIMIKTIDEEIARQQEEMKKNSCESHVRKSNPDGSTSFLRPMPGAARMYPETDLPLLKISRDLINETKKNLPKLTQENKSYLQECGLNDELITVVLQENKIEDFKTLTKSCSNYALIAKSLTLFQKEIAKREEKSLEEIAKILDAHVLEAVLENVGKKISEGDVRMVLEKIAKGSPLKDALKKSSIDLATEVKNLLQQKPGLSQGAYMGLLMAKFKGQVAGSEIAKELKKQVS